MGSEKTGQISDGYHTFDELYDHRCLLFINLCLTSKDMAFWRDGEIGWPILCLDSQAGQITYHIPQKYFHLVSGLPKGGPTWDGHNSVDVIERLIKLAEIEK